MDRNPQAAQMASEAMVRTLQAQADAIWPLEAPLFDRYEVPPGGRIVDVGCGTGVVTARVAARFPEAEVVGLDVHPPHVDRAREAFGSPSLRFETGDAYALDLPDGSADLVLCRHVLQSLPEPELVFAELHRVCRPGGRVHLLLEDYGMIHFDGTEADTDRFWREVVWPFADSIRNDLRIGRRGLAHLRAVGFAGITVDTLQVDTLGTDRAILAAIWEAWAEAYTVPLADHLGVPSSEVAAHWEDMLAAIRHPTGYCLWQVPVWSAQRP